MLSKLKEATIDMGPLPVKFSQFSKITKEQLLKVLPGEKPDYSVFKLDDKKSD